MFADPRTVAVSPYFKRSMLYTKNAHNAALPNIGLNELKSIADAAAGDATVDVGSDRRRKSSDRRVAALARR